MEITHWILHAVELVVIYFLGSQLIKKFHALYLFARGSRITHNWIYPGSNKPGMRNVVLHGTEPFKVLLCFKLKLPRLPVGLDWYGMVRSNEAGVVVFSTYLGKGICHFRFLVDTTSHIKIRADDEVQTLEPTASFPPHFWQRWGIYG